MSKKAKFRLALNPITGQLEWAPPRESLAQSIVGWLILLLATVGFLVVTGYVVYALILSSPRFDVGQLPGGGSSTMGQEVQQLRQPGAGH